MKKYLLDLQACQFIYHRTRILEISECFASEKITSSRWTNSWVSMFTVADISLQQVGILGSHLFTKGLKHSRHKRFMTNFIYNFHNSLQYLMQYWTHHFRDKLPTINNAVSRQKIWVTKSFHRCTNCKDNETCLVALSVHIPTHFFP